MRSVVLLTFAIVAIAFGARAQEHAPCAFDYVIEGGLIADTFSERTAALPEDPKFAEVARRILPNVKRVFRTQDGYIALVGWQRLPEDYSKFSGMQVRAKFLETFEYNKRVINPEAEASHLFDLTTPFSAFFVLEYLSKGIQYRDVSMDVVATRWCLLSVKFSGPVVQEETYAWDLFREELKRIRAVVAAKEGPVIFSEKGARFSWFGILNTLIYLGFMLAFAALAFFALSWRFRVEPRKAAWRYSAIIVALAALSIGYTIIANEALRGLPTGLPYENVLIYLAVLALHLAVLIVRTPQMILGAISFMSGGFATRALYSATGWLAVPGTGELIGIAVGVLLLAYVIAGTLRKKLEVQP
jgi:hypothetical protein